MKSTHFHTCIVKALSDKLLINKRVSNLLKNKYNTN